MDLSVIVPTLNTREELSGCLDALAERTPDAEVIVVNGPSADGTSGMVRDRDDVDVLVEIPDRTINAARNVGIDYAGGDAVAFVDPTLCIAAEWADAVAEQLAEHDAVTGPTNTQLRAGMVTEEVESRTIAGREVTYFNDCNVAFRREPLVELDGFDEYLQVGGTRDFAHRFAGAGFEVAWDGRMSVRREVGADGGERETDWGRKYRSLAYRLVKNYGLRPTAVRRLCSHAGGDTASELRDVLAGENRPSYWLGSSRDVVVNALRGVVDGLLARRRDRTGRRNPYGRSSRSERPVAVYDRR
jgi:hypothetical protein